MRKGEMLRKKLVRYSHFGTCTGAQELSQSCQRAARPQQQKRLRNAAAGIARTGSAFRVARSMGYGGPRLG
jgi:hypothetical protein